MAMRERACQQSFGDESSRVRHIAKEKCSNRIRNFAKARKINITRISAGADGNHFRLHFMGLTFDILIINITRLFGNSIGMEFIKLSREISRMPMGEMATMR